MLFDFFVELDTDLFLYLNSFHSNTWDEIMWWVSNKYSSIPIYLAILFFVLKKYKLKGFIFVIALILSVTIADKLSVHLFKNVFERLRPCHNPDIANLVHIVKNKCGGQYGFISSHATNSFVVAVFSSLIFKNKYFSFFIILWAVIVSYSRIYLGVHFPADVIGGAFFGSIIAYVSYFFSQKLVNKT